MNNAYNFGIALIDLKGNPITNDFGPINVSDQLAPALSGYNQGDPLKFYTWAVSMYQTGTISIDASDARVLRQFVVDTLTLNNLVKAQALAVIDAVK